MTRWLDPSPVEVPSSFAELNLHPLVAQTLVRRGIDTLETARAFLHANSLSSTPFPNIEPAVERILSGIYRNEMICVWGDFDVDGQSSTTVLVQTLQLLHANVLYYIPIRGKESHGVHVESLKPIIDNGVTLIVTCDTGITAHEAIEYANSRGVDVVITDHHELGETLPRANAIVNPKLLPHGHILENLAGVGVAYKLAEALLGQKSKVEGEMSPEGLLDLVALGLIADVALLKGETRTLVQKGIQVLRRTNRVGPQDHGRVIGHESRNADRGDHRLYLCPAPERHGTPERCESDGRTAHNKRSCPCPRPCNSNRGPEHSTPLVDQPGL